MAEKKYKQFLAFDKTPRICKNCGIEFIPRNSKNTKCCSDVCSHRHDYQQRKESGYIPPSRRGPRKCLVRENTCMECGKVFIARRSTKKFCSSECSKRNARALSKERDKSRAKKEIICIRCGTTFQRVYGTKSRFCSSKCRKDSAREARAIYRDLRKAKERAAIRDGHSKVIAKRVFQRDGWRCQICGKRTPENHRNTKWSNAPEVDHRIPLANGGVHAYHNVQCACRACNATKSNKRETGQMPLLSIG